ncbi:uncharacterized protein LOC107746117 [Sinocyclocheilus rhinocerous]|uniref:uncharacterized protein LOC107746117 n=1 Tax=Sinocyclocheilus rhinocerous TaxID=307959 RepID=UPI0007BA8F3E|nr:PREDICTED: uncharacterized protein LOC107746117 [Sinocyclocheilus rhinocerous]
MCGASWPVEVRAAVTSAASCVKDDPVLLTEAGREERDGIGIPGQQAVKECRRYIDKDMNRCFNRAMLSSPITDSSPYEVRRAQELNNLLGPKGSTDAMDLICDLHNTTANMGLTLIHYTTSDWVTLHICKYLQTKITKVPVRVLVLDVPISEETVKPLSPITDSSPYEVRRAQELNNLLGPKGSTDAINLICDLHNTTANMGLTLIHYTTSDWVTLHICKYLQTKITKVPVRVLVLDVPISEETVKPLYDCLWWMSYHIL